MLICYDLRWTWIENWTLAFIDDTFSQFITKRWQNTIQFLPIIFQLMVHAKKKKQHVFTELMVKRSLKKTENRRPTALVKINIWTRCSYLPRSYCDKRHYVKYVFYFYLKTYYLCVITYNVYNTFFKYPLGFYSKTLKINVVTYVKVSKIIMDEYLCTSINITW